MVLFPQIFSKNQTKYEKPAAYLITDYNAVSSNIRDNFSAGGQMLINVQGRSVLVPQIFSVLKDLAKKIAQVIDEIPEDKLAYHWRAQVVRSPRIDSWKRLLDEHARSQITGVTASEVYESGL